MVSQRGLDLLRETADTTIKTRREMKASADRWGFLSVAFSIILLQGRIMLMPPSGCSYQVGDRLAHMVAQ